ncbi:MAG: aminopeptidase P family protein [Acidobacteria bacterium]|nr:MAG: aminopeptidase P family protein [Acidobacteriota bacterium]
MDLEAIQAELRKANLDGWLFYDHHHRDPIAYHVLKIVAPMCTRRWYCLIPASGNPSRLTHRIERGNLDGVPGVLHLYSSWTEQRDCLRRMLEGKNRIAMQYSPMNDIPYVGLVDAGTVELVRSFGVEVVSSADLVQLFEARWSPAALASHLEAGKIVHAAIDGAFAAIKSAIQAGKTVTEYDVQQGILGVFAANGVETDEPPIVAVNANAANPHYGPTRDLAMPIRGGDFVVLDVWAKQSKPGAAYFDVTWTGFAGETVPERYTQIFNIVREARDAAVSLVKGAMQQGRLLYGYEVDDAARGVIERAGYGDKFIHRTGHSIGEDVHGNGANMDNLETHDSRQVLPGTCFSVEPGIYLDDFGVRSEVNVYVEEHDARVTGEVQQAIVPILGRER